ncbi:MAG: hypothetical protein HeimC3_08600 [Candidatus Heimdallarchaeota archaeon LC_3]|nr:MAG: hypothetical protein HeimC3_24190 [Candidatus Heimdallarchaeota archaeon LC_3]OLS26541.1 MAG: hypothetical protein HeimC3_08600 [Candidatus Heimdallarchaeota archaeon LC_3]
MSNSKSYESEIISNGSKSIAYWKFKENSTPQTFQDAFVEFNESVHKPEVSRLVVNVEMKNAWNQEVQSLWLKTGELADEAGIEKWGIVTPNATKKLTIQYLIKGGRNGSRKYSHLISTSESEVIDWAKK